MGVLSDFYVADAASASRYDADPESFPRHEVVGWKHLTPVEVSMLWCIARKSEWAVEVIDAFPCVFESDDKERWIHAFPDEFVRFLAAAGQADLTRLASEWAATEELACRTDEIQPLVDDLARLARSAAESSRCLYLWNSV
jgi:hypothetical protein